MKLIKSLIVILFVLMFLNVFLQAADNKQPKYFFKIATDAPDGSAWIVAFKEIDRELRKQTNGEVGMVVYPSSLMGDQSTVVKKIKIGQLSGGGLSSGGLELIYKDLAILGFPLVFRGYEEFDYAKNKLSPFFESELEKRDFVLMAWTEVGFIYVFSKKQVNSIENLQKSKPFLLDGDVVSKALFDGFDTKPIPIQMSDIMTGLQTGLIDTVFSSTYTIIVTQWFSKVNYMADFPITFMLGAVVLDKKLFSSMPKDYQFLMKKLFKDSFQKLSEKMRKDNEQSRDKLEKYGMKFLPVDKKQQEKFIEVCTKTRNSLTEKVYSKDVLDKVLKTVDEYRISQGKK